MVNQVKILKISNWQLFFRRAIKKGKEDHDYMYMKVDFSKLFIGKIPTTNEVPYYPDILTEKQQEMKLANIKRHLRNHENLVPYMKDWKDSDLQVRMNYFLRRQTQDLCRGEVSLALKLRFHQSISKKLPTGCPGSIFHFLTA